MNKLTPVLPVERIEPCLPFWIDRLGFSKTAEVPDGDRLSFVSLENGVVEIMLQTLESIAKDAPGLIHGSPQNTTVLFIEVDDVHQFVPKFDGHEIVTPLRKTFYGMEEIGVREPSGSVVVLASRIGD